MKKNKFLIIGILGLLFMPFLPFITFYTSLYMYDFYQEIKYNHTIKIGDIYTQSYKWQNDSNNPFEKPKIDTIKILDIKDGYVLWQFKSGFTLSSKMMDIKMRINSIDKKEWSKIKFKAPFNENLKIKL